MKKLSQIIRTTFVGGLLFLAPLMLLLILLGKALDLARKLVDPIVKLFPVDNVLGLPAERTIGLIVILIICLLAGILAKTRIAKSILSAIEDNVLMKIPGYSYYKKMGEGMIGVKSDTSQPIVLAFIEEAWQIGFQMDKYDSGVSAIFIPDSPSPWSGTVYYLTPERIKMTDITHSDALKILKQMGAGGKELLSKYL